MNELEDMSGFYQKMKNVETYQYLSSCRYIAGQKTPLCTALITLIKEARIVIMWMMISKKKKNPKTKLFKIVEAGINVWLSVPDKKCRSGNRRTKTGYIYAAPSLDSNSYFVQA